VLSCDYALLVNFARAGAVFADQAAGLIVGR
jgi:hypothetical protein